MQYEMNYTIAITNTIKKLGSVATVARNKGLQHSYAFRFVPTSITLVQILEVERYQEKV